MEIKQFKEKYISDVVVLWNKNCKKGTPYKSFTVASFIDKFVKNPNFSYNGTFIGVENGEIIAFANGIIKKDFLPGENHENTPGYLTFVLVDEKHRRKGYGSDMLRALENYFKVNTKKEIQITFFNPIKLEWNIPGANGHDHPNAPGVDLDGPGYPFFKAHNYEELTREVSMYLELSQFELPQATVSKLKELKSKGIVIEYYDSKKHPCGFGELFDNLKNEHWRHDISENLKREKPYPILVASDGGKICGFAGPIAVEPSGRGWFCGIGVDSRYRGMGIGTTLFFMLMKSFKDIGAKFSSLFTGENNPAKKMYDRAGFEVVKTWATMRKEI